jgi:signal transduction histidine kinase/CheY-like chemotaxis protein
MDSIPITVTSGTVGPYADRVRCAALRESVRVRCQQTAPAVGAVVLFAIALAALWDGASIQRIAAWQLPFIAGMAVRLLFAKRIMRNIEEMSDEAVQQADRTLRWSSIVNQTIVGAGIWIVGVHESNDAAYYVTFAILFFAIGAMINLSCDYRSFRASLPFLLVQPATYWSTVGLAGVPMVMTIVLEGMLMLLLVQRGAKTFTESVAIRMEKDALLEELRAQYSQTQRALATAEDAVRSKVAFLAAASHDLRQPLFALTVLGDTLLMHELSPTVRSIVSQQVEAIGVLRSLFDNLLDLSRFDAGGVRTNIRLVDLREVLHLLDVEFGPLCRAKGLAWRVSDSTWPVFTDPELLLRLLGNLLANAVRHTDRGSVSVEACVTDDRVRIEVADTGPGIDPADQRRIFDEFVQLGNANRDRRAGAGLGLAIVRRIDGLLGTGLTIQSAVGKGTKFSVVMPVARADVPAGEAAHTPSHDALPERLKVWLVEDDALIRSALSFQFDVWMCDYRVATSAAELGQLRATEGGWPDAIILDDSLGPGERGLDIARQLASQMSPHRILLVTGSDNASRMKEIRDSGFTLMRKPVAGDELRGWLSATRSAAASKESNPVTP